MLGLFKRFSEGLEIEDGVVKRYSGNSKEIIVPEGVSEIANDAFKGKTVQTVILPKSLRKIGSGCFMYCNDLEHINIPLSLNKVGDQAFCGCNKLIKAGLEVGCNMMLDPQIEIIPDRLFFNCQNLQEASLPPRVKVIGKEAFWNCNSLIKIEIPDSCELIQNDAFSYCQSLTRIDFDAQKVTLVGNVFQNCDGLVVRDGFVIFNHILYSYCGKYKTVKIPDTVKEIASRALCDDISCKRYSSIIEIIIPDSCEKIGDFVFKNCRNLKRVVVPNSVKSIGIGVFEGCSELEEVVVQNDAIKELREISSEIKKKSAVRAALRIENERRKTAENNAYNISRLPSVLLPFAKRFGGDRKSAEDISHFIVKEIGESDFRKGELYVTEEKIEFKYLFQSHSFFDDGGGYSEFTHLILEDIDDSGEKTDSDEKIDSEKSGQIMHNPFGLKGDFRWYYHHSSGSTD